MLTEKTGACGTCWTTSCQDVDFTALFIGADSTPVPYCQLRDRAKEYIDYFARQGARLDGDFDSSGCKKHDLCEFMRHIRDLGAVQEPNFCLPALMEQYAGGTRRP
jgi:hypothetical protein